MPVQIHVGSHIAHFPAKSKRYGDAKAKNWGIARPKFVKSG
jgi:hypothetical protein